MSAWRRKALALFPNWKRVIENNSSFYDFWFDFLPLTLEAHLNNDFNFLERIYGLAEWSTNEKSKDLWNATAVCFYEHLLSKEKILWPEILPWVSDEVIYKHGIKSLWNYTLGKKENVHLEKLLKERKELNSALKFSRRNFYTKGKIHRL
jgi:hypothetical protein